MRMWRLMMGIERTENISTEEIRARAGVANISKNARPRWIVHGKIGTVRPRYNAPRYNADRL